MAQCLESNVCLFVTTVSPTKTAELLFRLWTPVGPRNHVLMWVGLRYPRGIGNFGGISEPIIECREYLASNQYSQSFFGRCQQ